MTGLHFQGSILLLLLFGGGLVIFLLQYRGILGGKNTAVRIILSVCRTLVIIILVFLIANPVLRWRGLKQRAPKVAVFADLSTSMSPDSANTPDKIIGILERLEKKIG
ncbi:MAG: hypothetical protein GXO91_08770, partial [FCB group bacterium]|nr:hypothetical protein [FCB group bacterium]